MQDWDNDKRKAHSELMKRLYASGKIKTSKPKKECGICGKQISVNNYDKHIRSHKNGNQSKSRKPICPHCGKRVKNSDLHFENCRHHPEWKNKSNIWTEERKQKHSETMKEAVEKYPDSYAKNNVCGRVKIIEYNGSKLKGSWEHKVAVWLDRRNIKWESEVNPQPYFWDNKWKLYFPDFYLPEYKCYIEVKGYKRDRDESKWNHFPYQLIVIDRFAIEQINNFDTIQELKERFMHQSSG